MKSISTFLADENEFNEVFNNIKYLAKDFLKET